MALAFPSSPMAIIKSANGRLWPTLVPSTACPSSCATVANTSSGSSISGETKISQIPLEEASVPQHSPTRRRACARPPVEGNPTDKRTGETTGRSTRTKTGSSPRYAAVSHASRVG